MQFVEVNTSDEKAIKEMSELASNIVKEYYDPILGESQNDYMIYKFQSVSAIKEQLQEGYNYFFVTKTNQNSNINKSLNIGFMTYYPRTNDIYLSKFYLHKNYRGQGISRHMLNFIVNKTKEVGFNTVTLNVNKYNDLAITAYEKLGFIKVGEEKTDIGHGYYMDDYIYKYNI